VTRRDPKIPLSAVQAIIAQTIEAMQAGGKIAFEQSYPAANLPASPGDQLAAAIKEDEDFINSGGAPPVYEEVEEEVKYGPAEGQEQQAE